MKATVNAPVLQTRKLRVMEDLTKEEIVNRIKQSENDILRGRVITQEELEMQSENW